MSDLYEKAGEAFLTKKIDWAQDDVRALLVDTSKYRVRLDKDEFLSAIPAAARVRTSEPLTGKAASGFVCKADNLKIDRVVGPRVGAMVLYLDTKKEDTSRLIAYVDRAEFLPFLPNGGDLEAKWPDGTVFVF